MFISQNKFLYLLSSKYVEKEQYIEIILISYCSEIFLKNLVYALVLLVSLNYINYLSTVFICMLLHADCNF